MKVPEEYGGLGPLAGLLQPRAGAGRRVARVDLDAALGAPVDRRRRAADAVRLRGAEAQVAAAGREGPHLRVPADRARRRLGPGAARHDRGADRGRLRLHAQRAASCGRRTARSPTSSSSWRRCRRPRASAAGSPRSSSPTTPPGVTVEHRNAFMGLRGIENSVTRLDGRLRPARERDRQGGPGPQDRADDAQHRPARAAGDLRRHREVGDEDRARVRVRARPVGPAGRQARRGRAEDRVHRRDRVRPGGDARRREPARRRQAATTSASRRRSRSSTAPSSAGR